MNAQWGKYIILIGALIIIVGLLVYFLGDKLHWIGRLPGDIRVERGNFRFYFPVVTMILASLVITILVHLFRKYF